MKIGECKYRKQEYSEALQNYEKVKDSEDSEYSNGILYNNMGLCHYQLALYKEAEKDYRKAIEYGSVEAYYNVAVLYYNTTKNENKARMNFAKCLNKNNQISSTISSKAKDAIKLIEISSQSQSDWFGWWLRHEKIRKVLGLVLIFSILTLVVTTATVVVYISIIKGEIISTGITGLTIMVGFLVVIMLLPGLRKFKVAEIVELETTEITPVERPDFEPTLSPKLGYRSLSV